MKIEAQRAQRSLFAQPNSISYLITKYLASKNVLVVTIATQDNMSGHARSAI